MMEGTVKRYNDERGYGFVDIKDGRGDVFFHVTQLPEGARVVAGARVDVTGIRQTPKGRAAEALAILDTSGNNMRLNGGGK